MSGSDYECVHGDDDNDDDDNDDDGGSEHYNIITILLECYVYCDYYQKGNV